MKRVALGIALAAGLVRPAHAAWSFDWAGHVEVDAQDMTSTDADKRYAAVGQLGKYDVALTEDYLIVALDDPSDKVREQAAKVLGDVGSQKAVPRLVVWLSDPDGKRKQIAAEALGKIGGPDAAAALTRSLGDADAAVRQITVRALGQIGQAGNTQVVIALIPRLEDDKTDVKLATITQLEELGDTRAVIPMVSRFSDSSMQVRTAAVRAVGKLGDKSAVPALIRLTTDPAEDVRTAAVGALGALGAVEALDAMTDLLNTGSDVFKGKVAYALAQIAATPGAGTAGENAMKTLVANLSSPQHRQYYREALRVAGRAAIPALVAHLEGRLQGDPTTAVTLLGDVADARATATLAAELERGRVASTLVLRALGATQDPAALVPVLRALSSRDAAVRLAAMESLRPLVATDARAGDVLLEHLDDEDIEIRVLAVDYLGILRIGAAATKLTELTKAGNPTRLRRASVDALGEIGRPEAAPALLAVLKDGPTELHSAAATALGNLADAAQVPAIIKAIQSDKHGPRAELVRALGGILRVTPDPEARKFLRQLATDAPTKVALAAIAALAGAKQPDDAKFLRPFLENAASDRRRAVAWALGEMTDTGAVDALTEAIGNRDDRLAGDAAWALGEILVTTPTDARIPALADRFLYAAQHGGWSAAIDSTGALARVLWAMPAADRAKAIDAGRRGKLIDLVFHKSRFVRVNALHALAAIGGEDAAKAIAPLLADDASAGVRTAAADALGRIGGATATTALDKAAKSDGNADVRAAATAAKTPAALPARGEWRIFQMVDPAVDDAAVRGEPYAVLFADQIIWSSYTDARGYMSTEHSTPDPIAVWSGSRETEF